METLERSRVALSPRIRSRWWWAESSGSVVRATMVAIGGAALIGGLTSVAQQYLPPWVNSLSNSAGGWTMFSFLIVWLGRAKPLLAAALGIVVFQVLIESYSVVSEWRGFDDGDPFTSIWTVAGLLAGPLLGTAAALVRYAPPAWGALAVTPLSAVLLGEGIWALNTVADTTSPVYWTLEIVLSVVFLVGAILHSFILHTRLTGDPLPPVYVSVVVSLWLLGTLAFVSVLVFVLN